MSPFQLIQAERDRQDIKWGPQNHSQIIWLGILAEEFGELAKEVNELHFRPTDHIQAPGCFVVEQKKILEAELIQTAAVCVAMLESLWRNGK